MESRVMDVNRRCDEPTVIEDVGLVVSPKLQAGESPPLLSHSRNCGGVSGSERHVETLFLLRSE